MQYKVSLSLCELEPAGIKAVIKTAQSLRENPFYQNLADILTLYIANPDVQMPDFENSTADLTDVQLNEISAGFGALAKGFAQLNMPAIANFCETMVKVAEVEKYQRLDLPSRENPNLN